MADPVAIDDELSLAVKARLAAVDQRYTANRRHLVDILRSADRPLTMPDLLAAGDGLAQSSVYRNLVVLEQAGVVHRIVTDGDYARHELAEDLTGHHHHHLICSGCGAVEDFTVPSPIEAQLDSVSGRIGDERGFVVESHRLDLVGRCRDCA